MEQRILEGGLVNDRIEQQGGEQRFAGDRLLGFLAQACPKCLGRALFQGAGTVGVVRDDCQVAERRAEHGFCFSGARTESRNERATAANPLQGLDQHVYVRVGVVERQ